MVMGRGDIEGRQPINSGGRPNKAGSVCLRSVSSLLSLLWVQRDGRRHVARWNVGAESVHPSSRFLTSLSPPRLLQVVMQDAESRPLQCLLH